MVRGLSFIGFILIILFTLFVKGYAQDDVLRSYMFKGQDYLDKDQYLQAVEEFEKVLKINPDYPDVNKSLCYAYDGLTYIEKDSFYLRIYLNKAIYHCDKAITIKPDSYTFETMAGLCCVLGEHKKSIEYYEKAAEINSESEDKARDYNGIAKGYYFLGEYQKSIQYHNKTIELNPNDSKGYFGVGTCYLSLKQYGQAIGYLEKAIRLNPDYSRAYSAIGDVYYSLGRYKEAKENLLKAKELFQKEGNQDFVRKMEEYLNKLPK